MHAGGRRRWANSTQRGLESIPRTQTRRVQARSARQERSGVGPVSAARRPARRSLRVKWPPRKQSPVRHSLLFTSSAHACRRAGTNYTERSSCPPNLFSFRGRSGVELVPSPQPGGPLGGRGARSAIATSNRLYVIPSSPSAPLMHVGGRRRWDRLHGAIPGGPREHVGGAKKRIRGPRCAALKPS